MNPALFEGFYQERIPVRPAQQEEVKSPQRNQAPVQGGDSSETYTDSDSEIPE
jgi:hypothetical protein